jgi:cell division protein ZapE
MVSLGQRYSELVAAGELREEQDQKMAVSCLDQLQKELTLSSSKNVFSSIFRSKSMGPKGVYLWGDVGRGKSMLMDLFIDTLAISQKRRVHFHSFMQEVHTLLREERKSSKGDPIPGLAARISSGIKCLAFDEMVVNNSADAMIMSRLFSALLIEQGLTIVTTSNRPPNDLYKDGLNREHFLPFIDLVQKSFHVYALNGPVDYRLERLGEIQSWHVPIGSDSTNQVRKVFFRLTDYNPEDSKHVPSKHIDVGGGRLLFVPKSLKGVGVFSFKRLCADALGAPDYLAIARIYHTVILVGIPIMGPDMRNEAARFITLIDILYECRVKLFATAAAEPADLYVSGDGSFEFARTASRLMEMRSAAYMSMGHGST